MIYETYGMAHRLAKSILKRSNTLPDSLKLVSFLDKGLQNNDYRVSGTLSINETPVKNGMIARECVYPVENLVSAEISSDYPISFQKKANRIELARDIKEASENWHLFLDASVISDGYRNAGLRYAGFIWEYQQWCLPSWIWTNAALVRYYCSCGQIDKARKIGGLIINQQQECGGWIVRNDYTRNGVAAQLAPNDSCYIALNCCLELYEATGEEEYLNSAIRNAEWTIQTARPDGMVWFAYDNLKKEWIKDRNIVDTGFTAGLFAKLYEITGKPQYRSYLGKFIKAYTKAFYMPKEKCFSTAIGEGDCQFGGAFGRGQGWALEGLIPAYRVLKDENIRNVIESTIDTLLQKQIHNGGWAYNLLKPLMGEDCKAVPVLAKCLLDWYEIHNERKDILIAVEKALAWCVKHTATNGEAAGGIFSYTVEGAVVHHMYTNTAFVYGSSYALEVKDKLQKIAESDLIIA